MSYRGKGFLTLKRFMLIITLIVGIAILCLSANQIADVSYRIPFEYKTIEFHFEHLIGGHNLVEYKYYWGDASTYFQRAHVVYETGNFRVDAVPLVAETVVYIISFISALCAFACSFAIKDKKAQKIVNIFFGSSMLIVALIIFLTPAIAKSSVNNALKDIFDNEGMQGSYSYDNIVNVSVSGYIAPAIWSIVESALLIGVCFVPDCRLIDVPEQEWHENIMNFFRRIFGHSVKKTTINKPVHEKKPREKVNAEVVVSPSVDVSEGPKPVSEPEVERVSPNAKKEKAEKENKEIKKEPAKKPVINNATAARKMSRDPGKAPLTREEILKRIREKNAEKAKK